MTMCSTVLFTLAYLAHVLIHYYEGVEICTKKKEKRIAQILRGAVTYRVQKRNGMSKKN